MCNKVESGKQQATSLVSSRDCTVLQSRRVGRNNNGQVTFGGRPGPGTDTAGGTTNERCPSGENGTEESLTVFSRIMIVLIGVAALGLAVGLAGCPQKKAGPPITGEGWERPIESPEVEETEEIEAEVPAASAHSIETAMAAFIRTAREADVEGFMALVSPTQGLIVKTAMVIDDPGYWYGYAELQSQLRRDPPGWWKDFRLALNSTSGGGWHRISATVYRNRTWGWGWIGVSWHNDHGRWALEEIRWPEDA